MNYINYLIAVHLIFLVEDSIEQDVYIIKKLKPTFL